MSWGRGQWWDIGKQREVMRGKILVSSRVKALMILWLPGWSLWDGKIPEWEKCSSILCLDERGFQQACKDFCTPTDTEVAGRFLDTHVLLRNNAEIKRMLYVLMNQCYNFWLLSHWISEKGVDMKTKSQLSMHCESPSPLQSGHNAH